MELERAEKPTPLALRLGFFAIFIVAWIGLSMVFTWNLPFFHKGGWGMWPILAIGLLFIVVTIDRVRYLFIKIKADTPGLVARVQRYLMQGDVRGALSVCERSGNPMASIVHAGLSQLHRPDQEVQEAVDEASLYEMPRIERRTGYLAMMGNVATLLGLLGTIVGLITSFAGVSLERERDPDTQRRAQAYVYLVPSCQNMEREALVACIKQNKATILSRGISEAMHCTAFGLSVGILSLFAFSVLNGRTQRLIDDVSDGTVKLLNLAVSHRRAMNLEPLQGGGGGSTA